MNYQILAILPVLFFTLNVQAQEVRFEEHLVITEKVESFVNTMVKSLMPEFSKSEVKFARDENQKIADTFEQGFLEAKFYGVVESADTEALSEVSMDNSLRIQVSTERPNQYEINLKMMGEVSHPKIYIQSLQQDVSCASAQEPSTLCELSNRIDLDGDFMTSVGAALESVKQDLLRKALEVEDLKYDQYNKIRYDFINYLDSRIQIEISDSSVTLDIDLGDLASQFRDKADLWLNDNKLIDYSIRKIQLVFTENNLAVETHIVKYHVIKPFNGLMQAATSFQETLENPDVARAMAQYIKDNPTGDLSEGFKANAHKLDSIQFGLSYGKSKLIGDRNTGAVTETEENLGLD